MSEQQELSPLGTEKNCNAWADYEVYGSSETSKLCHGGMFRETYYRPCPSRTECQAATELARGSAPTDQRRHLPVAQPNPVSASYPGLRPTQSTALYPRSAAPNMPAPSNPTYGRPMGMPTTLPQAQQRTPFGTPAHAPVPIMPPEAYHSSMQSPYANHPHVGVMTPVFLPEQDESIFGRIMKNVVQGAIGSTGWHFYGFMSSVDIFKRR